MTSFIQLSALQCVQQLDQKQMMIVLLTIAFFAIMEIRSIVVTSHMSLKGSAVAMTENSRVTIIIVQSLVQQHSHKTVKSACHMLQETVTMVVSVAQVMTENVFLKSLALAMELLPTAMTHISPFLVHRFVPKFPPITWIHATLTADFNATMVMLLLVNITTMQMEFCPISSKSSVHATTAQSLR
jgi:hypothetical protein